MRVLLAICLVVTTSFVWAAEGAVPQPSVGGSVTGKILEVKLVENYTYLVRKTGNLGVGRFPSFDVFGTLGGSAATAPATAAAPLSMYTGKKKLDQINDAPVARSGGANAMTVAEIVTQSTALKGKTVSVRGKVVKFNPDIMGVNWIHLRDGSGSEAGGSNDLLVTTSATVKVGDVVTAEGVVAVDKDFGAGYSYKVLVEKATVQK